MHTWIDTPDGLAAWLAADSGSQAIGLDTEFMRTDTFRARLALVQICIGDRVALVDTVRLPLPHALAAHLRDAHTLCIMHSASEDLDALASMLPEGPAQLFDTQVAAAIAGLGSGLSYQKLVATALGIDLAKAETRSDWMRRPLSAEQLDYAAQDVVWLPKLHALLAARLDELGRSDWLREDCAAMLKRARNSGPDPQPQRAVRGAADWPIERQALLRRLLLWRDASARALDKPKPWILDDAHALQLASRPPATSDELYERTRGLRALRGPQRQELLALLLEPLGADDLAIEPIPPSLDSSQKRALGEMKSAVAAIAERHALPESVLCARRHLETLLTERAWPAALEGWRRTLLEGALMALMP